MLWSWGSRNRRQIIPAICRGRHLDAPTRPGNHLIGKTVTVRSGIAAVGREVTPRLQEIDEKIVFKLTALVSSGDINWDVHPASVRIEWAHRGNTMAWILWRRTGQLNRDVVISTFNVDVAMTGAGYQEEKGILPTAAKCGDRFTDQFCE
jgi:hypothetical protein